MNLVMKTVLYSYPSFDGVLDGIEKLVYFKAVTSYTDCNKTLKQADKILLLNNQADRIRMLKNTVNEILCEILPEERELLEYKYFKYKKPEGFDYTSRKYFRKQIKFAKKLDKIAEKKGFDEKWFDENFSDIYFLKVKFQKLKKLEEEKVKNSTRDSNA
ncbi:MAG: hypothetical protein SOX77_01325 [Candidatus Borkfalkiaceae bacterium]|nr:hypothetical protein [Christensenellaceae bacterium]